MRGLPLTNGGGEGPQRLHPNVGAPVGRPSTTHTRCFNGSPNSPGGSLPQRLLAQGHQGPRRTQVQPTSLPTFRIIPTASASSGFWVQQIKSRPRDEGPRAGDLACVRPGRPCWTWGHRAGEGRRTDRHRCMSTKVPERGESWPEPARTLLTLSQRGTRARVRVPSLIIPGWWQGWGWGGGWESHSQTSSNLGLRAPRSPGVVLQSRAPGSRRGTQWGRDSGGGALLHVHR